MQHIQRSLSFLVLEGVLVLLCAFIFNQLITFGLCLGIFFKYSLNDLVDWWHYVREVGHQLVSISLAETLPASQNKVFLWIYKFHLSIADGKHHIYSVCKMW